MKKFFLLITLVVLICQYGYSQKAVNEGYAQGIAYTIYWYASDGYWKIEFSCAPGGDRHVAYDFKYTVTDGDYKTEHYEFNIGSNDNLTAWPFYAPKGYKYVGCQIENVKAFVIKK